MEKELAFDFDSGEIKESKKEVEVKQPKPVEEKKEAVKPTTQTPAKPKFFKGIKVFRYGATDIIEQLDIDENTDYSDSQLIQKLNEAGFYEFKSNSTNFAFNKERGLMAVTIQGNSKG